MYIDVKPAVEGSAALDLSAVLASQVGGCWLASDLTGWLQAQECMPFQHCWMCCFNTRPPCSSSMACRHVPVPPGSGATSRGACPHPKPYIRSATRHTLIARRSTDLSLPQEAYVRESLGVPILPASQRPAAEEELAQVSRPQAWAFTQSGCYGNAHSSGLRR